MGCPLEKARQIADDVVRSVSDFRFVWKDRIFNVGVSVGLVEIGRDGGNDPGYHGFRRFRLLRREEAGRHPCARVFGARGGECAAPRRNPMAAADAGALRDNKFELYYQPIVHAQSGGVSGPAIEVFVRLERRAPAGRAAWGFMRAAERYRLMSLIDRWVVQAVLRRSAAAA